MQTEKPIILFDGVCNLCNNSIHFIAKRDKKKQFSFVSLQSEKGVQLLEAYKIPKETDSIVLICKKKVYTESGAILKIAKLLPAPWKWLTIFKTMPKNWRDKIYRWIARNRYRWFGKKDCSLI